MISGRSALVSDVASPGTGLAATPFLDELLEALEMSLDSALGDVQGVSGLLAPVVGLELDRRFTRVRWRRGARRSRPGMHDLPLGTPAVRTPSAATGVSDGS